MWGQAGGTLRGHGNEWHPQIVPPSLSSISPNLLSVSGISSSNLVSAVLANLQTVKCSEVPGAPPGDARVPSAGVGSPAQREARQRTGTRLAKDCLPAAARNSLCPSESNDAPQRRAGSHVLTFLHLQEGLSYFFLCASADSSRCCAKTRETEPDLPTAAINDMRTILDKKLMITSQNRIEVDLAYLLNISLDQTGVSSNRSASTTANEEDSGDSDANSPFSCYVLQLLAASHSSKIVFRLHNKLTTKKCTLHHTYEYIAGFHETGDFESESSRPHVLQALCIPEYFTTPRKRVHAGKNLAKANKSTNKSDYSNLIQNEHHKKLYIPAYHPSLSSSLLLSNTK
ncbi:hypothetical protein DV515_00010996 [Chloebia gouldiae]|uniref:Uncharacterized protein n=1 Tax=Chloebia gouldiae TaxID=44316 RepID=A0A3L8S7N2_CHLGU|nr:hypothetical protein DV515_00010996 [Chloebia gouldiae]